MHIKHLLVALVAALLLSLATTAATANRLSISDRPFRVTWAPMSAGVQSLPPEQGGSEPPIFIEISCNVTMEGSFHSSTIAKRSGALIGFVTRASVRSCTEREGGGGSIAFLSATLPWHVTYQSFAGTLPNITSMRVFFIGMGISVARFPMSCLSRSTVAAPAGWHLVRDPRTSVVSLRADEAIILPYPPTGTFCEGVSIYYEQVGAVTRLGATTSITLRLI